MRLKDYPRQIQVGENIWDIRFVQKLEDGHTSGLCDPSENTIYVMLKQTPEERLKTVLHEILHAIEHEYQICIPHKLVYALEGPLAQLIIDNYLFG